MLRRPVRPLGPNAMTSRPLPFFLQYAEATLPVSDAGRCVEEYTINECCSAIASHQDVVRPQRLGMALTAGCSFGPGELTSSVSAAEESSVDSCRARSTGESESVSTVNVRT